MSQSYLMILAPKVHLSILNSRVKLKLFIKPRLPLFLKGFTIVFKLAMTDSQFEQAIAIDLCDQQKYFGITNMPGCPRELGSPRALVLYHPYKSFVFRPFRNIRC